MCCGCGIRARIGNVALAKVLISSSEEEVETVLIRLSQTSTSVVLHVVWSLCEQLERH